MEPSINSDQTEDKASTGKIVQGNLVMEYENSFTKTELEN